MGQGHAEAEHGGGVAACHLLTLQSPGVRVGVTGRRVWDDAIGPRACPSPLTVVGSVAPACLGALWLCRHAWPTLRAGGVCAGGWEGRLRTVQPKTNRIWLMHPSPLRRDDPEGGP